jgi:protein-L-isoaspartate O-methyltransferase
LVRLYPVLAFLGAFLLFVAQPMAGRQLLPEFGGSPATWTTCLLFFQAALLVGYLSAYALIHRRWLLYGFILVSPSLDFLLLFIGPNGLILHKLVDGYGLYCGFLALLSPALQHSFAARTGKPPYRLYAFSNAGSLAGLLLYPFVIEPLVPVDAQRLGWRLAVYCTGALSLLLWRKAPIEAPPRDALFSRQSPLWILLSALPTALLAATTNQLTQDVAATPLLWILPLAVYLLAFILTFESQRWADPRLYGLIAGVAVLMACVVQATGAALPLWVRTLVYLIALFTGCMVCLSELLKRRPPAEALTGFYLALAMGGVLGTALVAFAAPLVFKRYDEFPLALIGCLAVRFLGWREERERGPLRWLAPALSIAAALYLVTKPDSVLVLKRVRGFHGAVQVVADKDEAGAHKVLTHGTIKHGVQYLDPEKRLWPTAYYGTESGAGRVLAAVAQGEPKRVAAIGLGIGTLAVYGRPEDAFRFFEINPDVAAIAQQDFRYLRESPPRVEIGIGDGRLLLAREPAPFDAIVVDAFSSDAIPTHLLTAEAGEIYRRQLKPGGHLLIHITNRSVDLTPVARGLARHLGWQAHRLWSKSDPSRGTYFSVWMLLSPDPASVLARVPAEALMPFSQQDRPPILWTDAHASLLSVLR